MSRYSSSSFAVFLVDGYNLLASKVKDASIKTENLLEPSHGLGDAWEEHSPSGMRKASLAQAGAFYDDTANGNHQLLRNRQDVSRIVCLGPAGNVIGRLFYGLQGAFAMAYEVLAQVGALTKANVSYTVSGILQEGVILQEWATKANDWHTRGSSVDNAAGTTAGGDAYLQVSGFSGPNTLTVIVQHSTDNLVWSTLATFAGITGAQTAQRVNVSGAVNRYLAVSASGFGNVSPSSSASASLSPSVSASSSASPSRSPSASISPSASTSLSPSASVSPSASTSRSPSASISPSGSTSLSPSTSVSPSASLSQSASASPSAGAGPASSVTLFCGFCRG